MPTPWRQTVNDLMLRPWFDSAAVPLLARWYFPLSRAWAAGQAAGRDRQAFAQALGRRSVPGLLVDGPLTALAARVEAHREAAARWEDAFFNPTKPADLPAVEAARLEGSHALMTGRSLFARLHMVSPVPPVRYAVATPEEVEARHGARRVAPDAATPLPAEPPDWEVSSSFTHGGARSIRWLRLAAPFPAFPGDRLWARVVEPSGGPVVGTIVFTHGIGMEDEHWRGRIMPLTPLLAQGFRLILPEGPGHGRRRCPGLYGGEQVFAGGPLGLLDYMRAHVTEIGLLIAWARALDDRLPVAAGGVSLGALTAQRVAVAAAQWPARNRPDGLLLVTPSRSVETVVFDGALTRALGINQALASAGWDEDAVAPWRPLLDPEGAPVVDPARTVMILGEVDRVTPYADGRALAEAWGVPPENVFTGPRGHFTTALAVSLNRDPRALARFAEVMGGCRGG